MYKIFKCLFSIRSQAFYLLNSFNKCIIVEKHEFRCDCQQKIHLVMECTSVDNLMNDLNVLNMVLLRDWFRKNSFLIN
jgi:hypothetical protein